MIEPLRASVSLSVKWSHYYRLQNEPCGIETMHNCVWMYTVQTYAYNMLVRVSVCGHELTKGTKSELLLCPF